MGEERHEEQHAAELLQWVAGWVRAEPHDFWEQPSAGTVYRRGRWLATFADGTGEPGIIAVSAYRYPHLAIEQLRELSQGALS